MKRGEVRYLRDTASYGHEIAMGRPVVILTSNEEIEKSEVVTVAFMTTTPRGYTGVAVGTNATGRLSWVLCNQINTVDQGRICELRGHLTDEELSQVNECLTKTVGITVPKPRVIEKEVFVEVPTKVDEIGDRVELDLYQKLYLKAMTDLVEARYKLDELQLKYDRGMRQTYVAAEKVIDVVDDEPVDIDVVDLKAKMLAPKTGELVEPVGRDEAVPEKLGKSTGGIFGVTGRAKLKSGAKITNINTCMEDDLYVLGMSMATARNIISYRKKHGKFTNVDELMNVNRFGKGCMATYGPMLRV